MSAYRVSLANRRIVLLAVMSLIASLLTVNFNAPSASAAGETVDFTSATGSVVEGGTSVTATLQLTAAATTTVAIPVTVTVADVDTTNGTDYTYTGSIETFMIGSNDTDMIDIVIPINQDTIYEGDEDFTLTLDAGVNNGSVTSQTITITEDDAKPTIAVAATMNVGESGPTADIVVTKTGLNTEDAITFSYATTENGGASGGGVDFTNTNTTGTITPTGPSTTVTVPINDDDLDEADESFLVTISAPSANADLGTTTEIAVTIQDNDDAPTLSIADGSVTEAGLMSFVVTRESTDTTSDITFNYSTTGGTATEDTDYTGTTSTGTITPGGAGTTTVTVQTTADLIDEADEEFTVTISGQSANAGLNDNVATGTILDNDAAPTLSIADGSVTEAGLMSFVVTRESTDTTSDITFNYSTTGGTATEDTDYTGTTSTGTITPGGAGTTTVTVQTTADLIDEADEEFTVTISGQSANAGLNDNVATGTILDDDGAPTLTMADVAINEAATNMIFTVIRSGDTTSDITFNYQTTGGNATPDVDYTAVPITPGTIAPGGSGEFQILVPILDDTTYEEDQTFNVSITDVSPNATMPDAIAQGTITNVDAPPVLTLSSPTASELAGTLTFVATISAVSEVEASAVANSVDISTEAADYTAPVNTPVVIPAGSTLVNLDISVLDDAFYETTETFTVNLSSLVDASGTPSGTGTITNNDAAPVVTIDSPSGAENGGPMTFTITRTGFTEEPVDATAATANGTAVAPGDFVAIVGQAVSIPASLLEVGTTTVVVTIENDLVDETLNEAFALNVTGITGGTPTSVAGTGTITDDDGEPALSIDDVSVSEGGTATFTVSRVGATALPISVTATTSNDTAVAPGDYDTNSQLLNIAVGNPSTTFAVNVNNDAIDENDEDFVVTLTGATNAAIADATGIGTITDTDSPPTLSIADATLAEDGGSMIFTITRTGGTERVVSVSATTLDDTAVAGNDYTSNTDSVTIPSSGATNSATFSVAIIDDPLVETAEMLDVNLTSPSNATIGDAVAVGTITDNDVAGVTITESDGNTSVIEGGLTDSYTVELAAQPSADVTVTIEPDSQLTVGSTALTFSNSTWNIPQTVTVAAVEDGTDEPDPHSGAIAHTTSSAHLPFNNLTITDIDVAVGDADSLLVTIDGPTVGAPGVTSTFDAMVNAGGTGTITYQWTAYLGGNPVDSGTSSSFDFTPTEGGIYLIEAIVGDSQGQNPTVFIQFRVLGDIGTSIFVNDIIWLAEEGITKGCNPPLNTEYCPTQFVTREQMAAFMVRFLGLTDDGGGNTFVDDDTSIFEDDIAKLAAAGITRGCNPPANTNFCPTARVTREQMAAFLVRALGLTDDGGGNTFVDDNTSIFEDDIAKLAAAGITRGCNPPANTNFCPTATVTRGQMAAFLRRADAIVNP